MKKLVLAIVLTVIVSGVFAQINVAINGNVGVKTTTPSTDFSVNGKVTINAPATINWESAIRTSVSNQFACAYHLYNSYYTGDVFYVTGEGRAVSRLGYFTISDINMKENVKNIDNPLSLIKNLHGVKYNYKEPSLSTSGQKERIGFIAQDVEQIIPQAVTTLNDGTKAIAYTDLIGVLVEAMKEQQTQIEELKKQVADLSKSDKN